MLFEEIAGGLLETAGVNEFVLGVADFVEDAGGLENVGAESEFFDTVLDESGLLGFAEDGVIRCKVGFFRVIAQQPGANGVESADPHIPPHVPQEAGNALFHLIGGFVGEGDAEDVGGRDIAAANQIGGAVGKNPGLATSRAGKDEQRPVTMKDGLPLAFVQTTEYILRSLGKRRNVFLGLGGMMQRR